MVCELSRWHVLREQNVDAIALAISTVILIRTGMQRISSSNEMCMCPEDWRCRCGAASG